MAIELFYSIIDWMYDTGPNVTKSGLNVDICNKNTLSAGGKPKNHVNAHSPSKPQEATENRRETETVRQAAAKHLSSCGSLLFNT